MIAAIASHDGDGQAPSGRRNKNKSKAPRAVLCVVEDVVQPEGVHVKGGHDMEASQNIVVEVNALGRD